MARPVRTIHFILRAFIVTAIVLVSEGCEGGRNMHSAANNDDCSYDTVDLDMVDISSVIDTLAADSTVGEY